MISIEVEGKTPEEAIEKALEVLSATREKVKVEILYEGREGLFGIGSKQAKVRATLLDLSEAEEARVETSDFTLRPTVAATRPPRPIRNGEETKRQDESPAKAVLEEVLRMMGFSARIEQKIGNDKITLSVEAGDDSNILIGRRGKNLNGLQYIINRICARKNENSKPIVIDIEGYRERRKESLEAMARRLASKAKSSRREMETEPLSAADRRLIHLALKGDSDVQTQSRGEGPFKNVVIKPKFR